MSDFRIAFCLHGLSHGPHTWPKKKNRRVYSVDAVDNWVNQIIRKYPPTDVFIHTWNPENQALLEEKLKPVRFEVCPVDDAVRLKVAKGNPQVLADPKKYAKYSRFYSMKRVVDLIDDYLATDGKGVKYDCVILTRFDVMVHFKADLPSLAIDDQLFLVPKPNYDLTKYNKYMTINFPLDYLFLSNLKQIRYLSRLYDMIEKNKGIDQYSHDIISEYLKASDQFKDKISVLPSCWVGLNFPPHDIPIKEHLKNADD